MGIEKMHSDEKKNAMERLYKITFRVIAVMGIVSVASFVIKKWEEYAGFVFIPFNFAGLFFTEALPRCVSDVILSDARIVVVFVTAISCLFLACPFWLMRTFHRRALRTPETRFAKTWLAVEAYIFAIIVALILYCWFNALLDYLPLFADRDSGPRYCP